MAAGHGRCISETIDLLDAEHFGAAIFIFALLCDQRRTERAHDSCNIRPDDFTLRDALEASKDRVVIKCSALHHNVLSQLGRIRNFDDLIEGVLNDRVSKAGGDIRNSSSFLLRLLDF